MTEARRKAGCRAASSAAPAAVAALVVALLAPLQGSASRHSPERVSWADERHRLGWIDVGGATPTDPDAPRDPVCRGRSRARIFGAASICSTEDGGRTWHRIFEGTAFYRDYARTSRRAGVVALPPEQGLPRTLRTGVFWTPDNGAHWFETTRIGRTFDGRGRLFHWTDASGRLLYRTSPWPPPRHGACGGFWGWHAFDQRPRRRGSVCVGAVENAALRSRIVARLPTEQPDLRFRLLSSIPGGVAAIVEGFGPLRFFARQGSENRIVDLPDPLPGAYPADLVLDVRWPRLSLVGNLLVEGGARRARWTSRDGGRTWAVAVAAR